MIPILVDIFSQPPLISFKRDKNIGNFLVRSVLLSLHQGSTESRKTLEQKNIFQIGTFNPNGINESFSSN